MGYDEYLAKITRELVEARQKAGIDPYKNLENIKTEAELEAVGRVYGSNGDDISIADKLDDEDIRRQLDNPMAERFIAGLCSENDYSAEPVKNFDSNAATTDYWDLAWERGRITYEEYEKGVANASREGQPKSARNSQVGGNHYTKLKIQPLEYALANRMGICEHAVVKYITRWRDKGGIQDLEKAKHYIDILIEREEQNV